MMVDGEGRAPSVRAKAYNEQLDAPLKGFYTFEQSAHSPLFEEPAKTCEILRTDVLAGANGLADPSEED